MRTNDDIVQYLIDLGMPFEQLDEGVWRLNNEHDHVDNIVVVHTPPITFFRVKLMEVPKGKRAELFEHLLRLNAGDMLAGAYGIEDEQVVIIDTLQSENLDFNEFQASIEQLSLAIAQHYPVLKGYHELEAT
ncbi:MAG: YbjN domain-containing protein [Myxococcota bacterium]|nr:YbjN domain-containing protein [Myxococcota bacterium]